MIKRRLGKTEIEVMPIGLGCWQFGSSGSSLSFWGELPQEKVDQIIAASIECGVNFFDTAESYGDGSSENALSLGLNHCGAPPGSVVIATKWKPFLRTSRSLLRTIGQRQTSLNGFSIDLYQIHSSASLSSINAQMKAMVKLLKAGRIRSVGVSNFSASMMRRAHESLKGHGYFLASNQVIYNLLNRSIETNGILQAARELGITIIAYSPLAQGLLTGKFHNHEVDIHHRPGPRKNYEIFQEKGLQKSAPLIELLTAVARAHDATPAQVALNWLVSFYPETVIAIPGASDARHAIDNAHALQFTLSQIEMEDIDETSRLVSK